MCTTVFCPVKSSAAANRDLHVQVNCTSTREITIIVVVQIQMKKFVQLMMSKLIPVRDLNCVKLVDVNYHNREGQLEGMYLLK